MKTTKLFMALAMVLGSFTSLAQGSGKVTLKAEIETGNELPDMQVSVINLASKDLVDRQTVASNYFSSLDLGNRYMLYFKKEGHPATRLIIDTHVPEVHTYYLNLKLNLSNLSQELETGISLSVGTVAYNTQSAGFELKSTDESHANLLAITYRGVDLGVATF